VRKTVATWNGAAFVVTVDRKFIYDGWNLIAEYSVLTPPAPLALLTTYIWGLDLSKTLQDGGGVGGLLAIFEGSTGAAHFPAYDGNGNLHALVSRTNGAVTAAYEYDAFGQTLRATGTFADKNPFRFSTKYTDPETGLLYYGRRYYNPSLGRWLGRDPIEEKGGLHLYGFVGNNGVNKWDVLGMVAENDSSSGSDEGDRDNSDDTWRNRQGGDVVAGLPGNDGVWSDNGPYGPGWYNPADFPGIGSPGSGGGSTLTPTGVTFSVPVYGGGSFGSDGQRFIDSQPGTYEGGSLPTYTVNANPLTPPSAGMPPYSVPTSIGQPSFLGGLVPIYGPGRSMIDDFQNRRIFSGVLNGVFLAVDIVTVGVPVAKLGIGAYKMGTIAVAAWTARDAARKEASILLRKALEAAGENGKGFAAHHIVEWGRSSAAPARAKLAEYGIDINSALNGVFLPQRAGGGGHYSTYPRKYTRAVNDALRDARSPEDVIDILNRIRDGIRNGTFP